MDKLIEFFSHLIFKLSGGAEDLRASVCEIIFVTVDRGGRYVF